MKGDMKINKKLHVGVSHITNKIFCGTLLEDGSWDKDVIDVTNEAIAAVAVHALHRKRQKKEDLTFSEGEKVVMKIEVHDLSGVNKK